MSRDPSSKGYVPIQGNGLPDASDERVKGYWAGGLSGASQGFSVGGPWGALIGGIIGHIGGVAQGAKARKDRLAFEAYDKSINPIDPNQTAYLNKLRMMERAYRAGTDPSSSFAKQQQSNALAQTQQNILRGGGGTSQMLRAQQMSNIGNAQIGAAAAQNATQLIPLQGNMVNLMAQRQWERTMQHRALLLARAEQRAQDLNNMMAGGMATAPQIGGGQWGGLGGKRGQSPYNGTNQNQYMQGMGYNSPQNFGFNYQQPTYSQQGIGFNYQQPSAL